MPRGIYKRTPRTKSGFLDVARCKCGWAWKPSTGFGSEACPKCGVVRDVRRRVGPSRQGGIGVLNERRSGDPGIAKRRYARDRRTVLLLVGKGVVACVRCSCPRPELLEINHMAGGGGIELRAKRGKFYREIATLRRDTSDLEILCRVCNAHHALELKHGPLPFVVKWGGS